MNQMQSQFHRIIHDIEPSFSSKESHLITFNDLIHQLYPTYDSFCLVTSDKIYTLHHQLAKLLVLWHSHITFYVQVRQMWNLLLHLLEVKECCAACRNMCLCECLWLSELHPTNLQNFPKPVCFSRDTKTNLTCCFPLFTEIQSSSMRTLGMAVFKQQKVEDFYDIGEDLGR